MSAMYLRERLEILHLVERGTHGNLQHHAVVRHPPLLVVIDVMLAPFAGDAEQLHVIGEVARHECVEARCEGTASAKALGPSVDVAYLGM